MAEETEGQNTGAEATAGGADPAAVALALGGASREKADAFLDKQGALIEDQRHHLREQLKQLRINIWEKYLGVLLRVAVAFIGVAVAAALAWLVWSAANSNALVIDAFAVPPDLAARGLSGPVVAAKLSDKIAVMQAETTSLRPPKSYASGLTEGLKLEIPETGVSLSELDNFLHDKLGHDQHISGEMVQTDNGVALTARVGSDGSATVTGANGDMDALLQKLAEQIYRITQSYRYIGWASAHGHQAEAHATSLELATSGPPRERPWGYLRLGIEANRLHSEYAGLALLRRGLALDPNNFLLASQVAATEYCLGLAQDSQHDFGAALNVLLAHGREYSLPDQLPASEHFYRSMMFLYQGALLEAADESRNAMLNLNNSPIANSAVLTLTLAAMHQPGAARAALTENFTTNGGPQLMTILYARLAVELEARDWQAVLTAEGALPQLLMDNPGLADSRLPLFNPLVALALAHMGQFAEAEAQLKAIPANCYPCLMARAQVAAMQGQHGRADYWFAHAVAITPSLPFAESEWGQALLDRGQPDDAIAKFTQASQKGPHFADPLEMWGEALMAKNRSDLALTKFEEAAKYAPNWGRLHLKWGEALGYAGKKDEAAKQFALAATLDLTAADKAELARQSKGKI